MLLANPPYGKRLQPPQLSRLYRRFGEGMKTHLRGWEAWLILGEDAPYRSIGLAPHRIDALYNGGMAANLAHYRIHR